MKKIILLIFTLLITNICFAENKNNILTPNNNGFISNKRGLIIELREKGALGYICPKWSIGKEDCLEGKFVYFDIDFDKEMIDYQKFTVPPKYSFYAKGVYRYKTLEYQHNTVKRIEIRKKDKNYKEEKLQLFQLY